MGKLIGLVGLWVSVGCGSLSACTWINLYECESAVGVGLSPYALLTVVVLTNLVDL